MISVGWPSCCAHGRRARDRWVLLLLDGRRTLADLARLTHRSELDIAYTLAQFLRWGYIEWVDFSGSTVRLSLIGS